MTAREVRLRSRIDRLTDQRDLLAQQVATLAGDLDAVRARDDYHGRMILTLRGQLREARDQRDEALAALWAERDMTTRATAACDG